jgi:hypothetical protein
MAEQQLPDIEEGDEQRRDAMLLRALKTPPKPRPKRERKQAKNASPAPSREKR